MVTNHFMLLLETEPTGWRDSTISLIKKLINAGADINAKNDDGKTPYDLCQQQTQRRPKNNRSIEAHKITHPLHCTWARCVVW